jgi:hypothetical protein
MRQRFVYRILSIALAIGTMPRGAALGAGTLTLQVNPANGLTLLKNASAESISLTSYRIVSAAGALNVAGWNPISNGNELPAQFPPDNGIDDGIDWEVALNPTSSELVEWYVMGASPLHAGQQLNLGNAVNAAGMPPLEFTYTLPDETLKTGVVNYEAIPLLPPTGDYNNNGVVDAADYVVWRKTNINAQQGYDDWRTNFGKIAMPSGAALGSAIEVPEPRAIVTVIIAVLATIAARSDRSPTRQQGM